MSSFGLLLVGALVLVSGIKTGRVGIKGTTFTKTDDPQSYYFGMVVAVGVTAFAIFEIVETWRLS
jgi:hypothetical protein